MTERTAPLTPEEMASALDALERWIDGLDYDGLVALQQLRAEYVEMRATVERRATRPAMPCDFDACAPLPDLYVGAWSLRSTLDRLADAADHLLRDHDCDAHGWEGVDHARNAAREMVARLTEDDGKTCRERGKR